jgi:hypothetical protein
MRVEIFRDPRACESGVALRFPPQSRTRFYFFAAFVNFCG